MRLFVDTGAWFALNSRSDENHRTAAEFVHRFKKEPVLFYTTDYVVDETVTLLRFKASHSQAVGFLDFLAQSANLALAQVTGELVGRAEGIFRTYTDKRWSFTDCVSFAFMDELGLEEAFCFDQNFAQYGKILCPEN